MINLSAHEEQERIEAVFKLGALLCASALLVLLKALITILLVFVNIISGIINFSIGILTILKAVFLMFKLLLTQSQDLTEAIERRLSWTSERYG